MILIVWEMTGIVRAPSFQNKASSGVELPVTEQCLQYQMGDWQIWQRNFTCWAEWKAWC